MGFFSDFKEQLATGGNIVTKTVEGTVANVGRLKIQMIDEMAAQGYNLVNEVSEEGYAQKFYGTIAMIRYTLTFKIDPVAVQKIEERKKAEEEEKRKEQELWEKQISEAAEQDKLIEADAEKLRKALGYGYCVIIEGNAKSAVYVMDDCLKKYNWCMYKKEIKIVIKVLKKYGNYCALSDFGEKACKNLCSVLTAGGVAAKVIPYKKTDYINQIKMQQKIIIQPDIFSLKCINCNYDIACNYIIEKNKDYKSELYSMLIAD